MQCNVCMYVCMYVCLILRSNLSSLTEIRMCISDTGSGRVECKILDKPTGFKCLATLMGMGHSRVRRSHAGAPDLRHGQRPYQSKPGTWTVDGFLQVAYDSIAETLPDQSIGKSFWPKFSNLFPWFGLHNFWGLQRYIHRKIRWSPSNQDCLA